MVSPLIALMNDQWRRLSAAGHPVAMVTSAMSDEAVRDSLAQVRGGEARIVYCSPERFGSTVFLGAIEQRRIDLLAVDEAHCVSEWGHDFRPDYLRLPEIAARLGRPTVMACTATATEAVAREIAARFEMREPLQVRSGFDRPSISFDVVRLEGTGSKARRTGAARSRPRRPGEPPGDRLLRHPPRHRRGRRDAARSGPARPPLPRRHGVRGARRRPGPLHGRRGRGHRRHQRLRHGGGQSRRALGLAHGDPDQPRGLLPGGRAGGPRRAAGQGRAAGDEGRPRAAWSASTSSAPATPSWRSPTSAAGATTSTIKALHLLRALPPPQRPRPLRRRRAPAARWSAAATSATRRAGCPTPRRSPSAAPAAPRSRRRRPSTSPPPTPSSSSG